MSDKASEKFRQIMREKKDAKQAAADQKIIDAHKNKVERYKDQYVDKCKRMNVDKMADLTTIKRSKALAYPMPSGLGKTTYQMVHNGTVHRRPKTVTAKPVPEEMSDPNRKACKAPAFMDQLFFNPTTAKKMIDHRIQEANSFPLEGTPTTAATIVNHFAKRNPLVKTRPHDLDISMKNAHKVRMEGYS